VTTAADAARMSDVARQRDVTFVGIDAEFRFSRPGVDVGGGKTAYLPRSTVPLLLSLALAEPRGDDGYELYRFVVDVRNPGVLPAVGEVLRLPATFVGHYLRAELFCLWKLGLEEPWMVWDTMACESALHLGLHHKRYRAGAQTVADEAAAREDAEEERERTLSLLATCSRYGVTHPFAVAKDRLQQSFLAHPAGAPFTPQQIDYAAADAVAAAELYLPQVVEAARRGVLHHLVEVEMPAVVTVARQSWRGVRFDPAKTGRALAAAAAHRTRLDAEIHDTYGIENVGSYPQLEDFFQRAGVIEAFSRDGKVTFDKEQLELCRDAHPAVPLVHAARRVRELGKQLGHVGALTDADDRVHPDYVLLGAHTGRLTSRWPNVTGLGRIFRPLVVPDPGRGIGEVDLCQIEVGLAAAVYGDDALVAMFNSDDVYVGMAKSFFAAELPADALALSVRAFKAQYSEYRDRMKVCTLGVIYGLTSHGMATRMGVSEARAGEFLDRFMSLFPALRRALEENPCYTAVRGCVANASGLRRYRARAGVPSTWERNWINNYPVQGSAATVFKDAMNRLDRLYRRYDAWLVIPMHDAVVFEAPLEHLAAVAELTGRVMIETVREWFPALRPRVEVNVAHAECWNKDGHADSLERWAEDPSYTL
jgi:DNA polymerase-1